jgi:hypothetical protein
MPDVFLKNIQVFPDSLADLSKVTSQLGILVKIADLYLKGVGSFYGHDQKLRPDETDVYGEPSNRFLAFLRIR